MATRSAATIRKRATRIRGHVLRMCHAGRVAMTGAELSVVDALAVLYGGVLRVDPIRTDWVDRDRLILADTLAAVALYATLSEFRFFPLRSLEDDGGEWARAGSMRPLPGIELLAVDQAASVRIALGMALAGRESTKRVFVVVHDLGDDDSAVWGAVGLAGRHEVSNLTMFVESRREVGVRSGVDPLGARFSARGWRVIEVDGHDYAEMRRAFERIGDDARPTAIIGRTMRGAGVSLMEARHDWSARLLTASEVGQALEELREDV